jgi:hypothetical protein
LNYETLWKQAYDGLHFMLKNELWNTKVEDHIFPRTIATGATKRKQYVVSDSDTALLYYKASLYEDCFLNAYPDYERLKEMEVITEETLHDMRFGHDPIPHHLVIDLDSDKLQTQEEFQKAYENTLYNTKTLIRGDSGKCPTVVWSGNGYHIHIIMNNGYDPLDRMHQFHNFKELGSEVLANKFLKFAESRLTNGKADKSHSPAIKSSMFRIPGTLNTKAKMRGKDPMVRIVQSWAFDKNNWGGNSGGVTQQLFDEFHSMLVQERIDSKVEKLDRQERAAAARTKIVLNREKNTPAPMLWIDKILQHPIEDGRRNLLFWVLAPYLITIRGMDFDKAYSVLETWLEKCHNVRRLEPDWSSFRHRLRYCLKTAEDQERKPIRFETFKEYYPELYEEVLE